LLNKAGINYAVLGTEEKCNGDSARRLGNEFLAQTLIKENVETLKKYKFKKILVTCPHCLQTIGNEYKQFVIMKLCTIHNLLTSWLKIKD
jgi:Fe-S oxidoreductase